MADSHVRAALGPLETKAGDDRLVRKLRFALGAAICAALEDPLVIEIMLNPDGQVFVERARSGIARLGTMPPGAAEIVIGVVAHATGSEAGRHHPVISGELPWGGHRFEGLLPPVVTAPSFTIRRQMQMVARLDEYAGDAIMSPKQIDIVKQSVRDRKNIVVCGGTGSGKTTLANAILGEIVGNSPLERLVVIEDTIELGCHAQNWIGLRTSDHASMTELLRSTLRLRPDRIIVGEVRDGAALTLLKAWNTGHPGGVTTVHANDATSCLRRLEQLVGEVSMRPMTPVIAEAVNVVISIQRVGQGRRVTEILEVIGQNKGRYLTRAAGRRAGRADAA